jgi:adenosylcobinamide-phosphate synthase
MIVTLAILAALVLDALLGEPQRLHPLVGFGRLALALERRWHGDAVWRGLIAVLVLLIPFTLLAALTRLVPHGILLDTLLLYLALGWQSLGTHARRVRDALLAKNLPEARRCVGLMVSRDTARLDPVNVSKATVESVLENGNDAIFSAIFWFVVAGAPGAVLYRLANTLDAMWGYRNKRYRRFGWAAARLDDALNFIPARLTALSYALAGHTQAALRCWRQQGLYWKSPNAGPVMAAGAGSLGVQLGGPASYHGVMQHRPLLGEGRIPNAEDIDSALQLIRHSLMIWVVALAGGTTLVEFFASR